MIILPTEKRIDWRYPPVVLITLFVLNVSIYLFYQLGDDERFFDAYDDYIWSEFYSFEAEAYEAYLLDLGYAEDDIWIDEYSLLLDFEFYDFLQLNADEIVPESARLHWDDLRPKIHEQIQNVSAYKYGLIPNEASLLTLLSHQFLHGDLMHLIGNMVFLVICGFAVEAALGHLRFLVFYLLGGIIAGGFFAWLQVLNDDGARPLVGASGSISAVMAMYLMIFRLRKIQFFYWVFIFAGYFRAPALVILPFYIGNEIYSLVTTEGSNVAFMAHVGGFVAGSLFVGLTLLRQPDQINEEYLEEDQDVDPYREKLDKLYQYMGNSQFEKALSYVEALLKEYGEIEELALLRFKLLGLQKGDAWLQAGECILKKKESSKAMLSIQETVLTLSGDTIVQKLTAEEQIRLGIKMMQAQAYEQAVMIAELLDEQSVKDSMYVKLLYKLAEHFSNTGKADQYNRYNDRYNKLVEESLA